MLSSKRKRTRAAGVLGPIARTLVVAFTLSAAACSADVTRFDFGGRNTTSSIPVPPEPVGNGYRPSASPRGLGLTEAPLPPPSEPPASYRSGQYDTPPTAPTFAERPSPPARPDTYRVVGRQYKSPPPASPLAEPPPPRMSASPDTSFRLPPPDTGGNTIEVQPGETLYSIGRRYGVAPAAIKDANGLASDSVRPGQRLVMPLGNRDLGPFSKVSPRGEDRTQTASNVPSPSPLAPDRTATARQAPAPAAEAPPGWEGRHVMKNGESLHAIALRHRVSVDELQRANGITDPTKVWAGTVLNVPGSREPATGPMPPADGPPRLTHTPPRIINAAPEPERKIASRSDITSDVERPAPETTAGKFAWPVRGKVIAGFGRRPDGTHNDGVNVAVPQGTSIHAVDAGKVAYAGNELKGYGKLVLIRHANGWVSAYAHADQLLVRKDDEVRRGQVIAKAGKTGAVDQPQVHFELRQGSRPVDPMPHLAN